MGYFNIDIIILSIFLLASIVIGLTAGRRIKTLRQYAIGDKNFSTAAVTYSLVISWITGGFFFNALQNIYATGLIYILVFMGGSLAMLLYGQVLVVRMGEFLNNLSVAEAMRDLYGRKVQIITAICDVLVEVGYLTLQFQVISKTFQCNAHFIRLLQGPGCCSISTASRRNRGYQLIPSATPS